MPHGALPGSMLPLLSRCTLQHERYRHKGISLQRSNMLNCRDSVLFLLAGLGCKNGLKKTTHSPPFSHSTSMRGCDEQMHSCGRVNRSWRFLMTSMCFCPNHSARVPLGSGDTRGRDTCRHICQPRGKTRVFNYEGPTPPGIADLGLEVWRGSRPPQQRGFVALGTPIGTPEYVRAWGAERLEAEDTLHASPASQAA